MLCALQLLSFGKEDPHACTIGYVIHYYLMVGGLLNVWHLRLTLLPLPPYLTSVTVPFINRGVPFKVFMAST